MVPGTDKLLKASEEFMYKTQEKMDEMTSDIGDDFLRLLGEIMMEEEPMNQVTTSLLTKWCKILMRLTSTSLNIKF